MSLKLLMVLGLMFNISTSNGPIYHEIIETTIGDQPLTIYTLVVDMNDKRAKVKNALSKEVIYGLETTSQMAKREEAYAAVNGTFYDNYGHHIGGMMIEGEWITLPTSVLPTVMLSEDKKISIEDLEVTMYVESEEEVYQVDGMNRYFYTNNELLMFTPIYGSTTRIYEPAVNYIIREDKVVDVIKSYDGPIEIPKDSMVLVDINTSHHVDLQKGQKIHVRYEGAEEYKPYELFQASSYLVKDGTNVSVEHDPVIGLTRNREPRTLLGVTEDNRLIINVVDGRDPNHSVGLSGFEAAELMIQFGCTDAVLLDGGASSTMVLEGEVINNPSNRKERSVGHSILINISNE